METYDLLVVGGGINGVGIARDAAGRGLAVALVEQDDLGAHTSSASSKLIHGGLRYLERYRFRLVREALGEREVLLRNAPHLVRPMRFVMPHVPQLRPAWLIRTGLVLYDWFARSDTLPGSRAVDLGTSPYGAGFRAEFRRGFVYSDCWVDDARLVVLTARAAAELGAVVLPRTACIGARRSGRLWRVTLRNALGASSELAARAVVNVAGPWVGKVLTEALGQPLNARLKLVKGSHIVVPRLFEGKHACLLQNDDGRIVFAYAYEGRYTLVGTTDVECAEPAACVASASEVDYLCRAVNRYFRRQVEPAEVAWSYCGIRALLDDGAGKPADVSRDYALRVSAPDGDAPVLSVFGGKITTHRRLAERALEKLHRWFPAMRPAWTAGVPLPGGALPGGNPARWHAQLASRYPGLPASLLATLAGRHGTLVSDLLGPAEGLEDLGADFGAELYAREVDYLIEHEWARSADDVLWRRTKAGLHLSPEQRRALARYVEERTR
jgi:glycerol-3-phosphate dehydrogenase